MQKKNNNDEDAHIQTDTNTHETLTTNRGERKGRESGKRGKERECIECDKGEESGKRVRNKGEGYTARYRVYTGGHSPSPTAFNLLFLLLDRAQHSRIGQVQWFADLLVDLDPKNNKEKERER